MGINLLCTIVFFTITSAVIGYLAGMVIAPGAERWFVFRFVGTAGILTYGTANILNGIWFGRKMIGDIADGIAYGLITGAIFALFQPGGRWRRGAMLALAVPIAMLGNAVRLTLLIVVAHYAGVPAAMGALHDLSGYLVFAVALAALGTCRALLTPRSDAARHRAAA